MSDDENNGARRPREGRVGQVLDLYLGGFAATLLFGLMILTFVDVTGRKLFGLPVPGGYEIVEIMMAILVFAGLPVITRREAHITIDLLDSFTPRVFVVPQRVAVNLISAGVLALMAWQTWIYADNLGDNHEITHYLHLPVPPYVYFMSIMCGLTTLVLLVNAWRHGRSRSGDRAGGGFS